MSNPRLEKLSCEELEKLLDQSDKRGWRILDEIAAHQSRGQFHNDCLWDEFLDGEHDESIMAELQRRGCAGWVKR